MNRTRYFALLLGLWACLAAGCHREPGREAAQPSPPPPVQVAAPAPVFDPNAAPLILHIGKATLTTEIAANEAQREQGLMYRPRLGDNNGMIFLMPVVRQATFWMKNTLIPLSVAYIDSNGVILEIHDMQALDTTITRSNSDRVAYALETNLHWFTLNGIQPGAKLEPPPAAWGVTAQP